MSDYKGKFEVDNAAVSIQYLPEHFLNEQQFEIIPDPSQNFRNLTTSHNSSLKVCHICNAQFTKTFSLSRHLNLHTGHKPHKCAICGFSFIQKSDLSRHLAVHTDLFPYVCNFENCGKKFRTKRNMQSHQTNTHLKRGFYRCPVCRKRFKFISTMKMHYTKDHTDEYDIFECDLCGKTFKSKHLIRKHFMRHLKAGKNFKPKYQTKFDHFKYQPTSDENDSEEEIKVTFLEETELTPEEILTDIDFGLEPSEDQFEVEMVTEVFEDVEIKSELFVGGEKFERCESWASSTKVGKTGRKNRSRVELEKIRQAKLEKEKEADRDYLQLFLPHMRKLKKDEKKRFKLNVKKILRKVLKS